MKNIDSIKLRIFSSICFAIAGILGLVDKNYLLGGAFILMLVSNIILIISLNCKMKLN
ncbi:hypothetical protein P5E58_13940 [Clostridium perfringens]|nr:hypothetical protein [Clostridium perfringens]MDK0769726.1 hypothetical protein [Clostridium perfringens]MDK0772386.1 hypothetical protein [Clostridium perfringens]MDK0777573.1 hypothetical protein [Clostridium perfringens]